jgi:iron(II)-dependent oxidoreductase
MHPSTVEHGPDGAIMVLIPAGPFLMGLPENDLLAEDHEKPPRQVELDAYWIDVYPVTNGRYARFLEAGGYDRQELWAPAGWEWKCRQGVTRPALWGEAGWDAPEQPAAGVSWYEADAYARWAGRRLPTDAEWEKAARGSDGRRYPWGNDWPGPSLANFGMVIGRTTPVGLFPAGASPYGCHDMAGNVNNWTSDWYWDDFPRQCIQMAIRRNPHCNDAVITWSGVPKPWYKVDRGGGFATALEHHEVLGCTRKVHWVPATREPWNGFRTAGEAILSATPRDG